MPSPLRATARPPQRGSYADPYFCEWGAVVGDRVRRLRHDRGLSLHDLGAALRKPERGGSYSPGFISRLERGRSSAPLYVYLGIADVLEVDAGALLGPDAASVTPTDSEATLLQCIRALGIQPHEAILTLTAR